MKRNKKDLEKKTDKTWYNVIRLHPRMQNSLEKVCIDEKKQIVKADAYPDIQELLAAAQVVITDYSCCIFDFLFSILFSCNSRKSEISQRFYANTNRKTNHR